MIEVVVKGFSRRTNTVSNENPDDESFEATKCLIIYLLGSLNRPHALTLMCYG